MGGRKVSSYQLRTGIRTVRVAGDGRLLLNGKRVHLRGVGVHEESQAQGFAVDNAFRSRLVSEVKAVGATLMRTHYPLHPYTQELADKEGVLIWSEVPVYTLSTPNLSKRGVIERAAKEVEKNIVANQTHPSVLLWSIANELSSRPRSAQTAYIKNAVRLAKSLDPSRPVGLAVAGYPTVACQPAYRPLDVIGINDYFGWYPGPGGGIFDRNKLSPYLDTVRKCYPKQALMVTEFGAEANRDGPPEEKGSYAYQQEFVNYHLGVYNSKDWLSGAVYWALNEFKVRPGWDGGNPRPTPPRPAPEGPAALRRSLTQARVGGPAPRLHGRQAGRLAARGRAGAPAPARGPDAARGPAGGRPAARASAAAPWAGPRRAAARRRTVRSWAGPGRGRCRRRRRPRPAA